MKITNHIYFYPNKKSDPIKSSNTAVIVGDNKQIMIDPGVNIKQRLNYLIGSMKEDGLDIRNTTEIWLTHCHPDHSHLIRKLVGRFKVKVRCHWLAKKILEAKYPIAVFEFQQLKAAGRFWKMHFHLNLDILLKTKVIFKFLNWRRVKIDYPVFGGEKLLVEPLEVYIFSLPGHTPDEIGFWIPEEQVLIIGDLIHPLSDQSAKFPILNNFLSDADYALDSIKKIKGINTKQLKIILPSHGQLINGEDNIQKILNNLFLEIEDYKEIAENLIQKKPNPGGISLINRLAEIFAMKIFQKPSLIVIEEMKFVAFAILKSLGVIK